jgi:amino acid adenylation domain-containing protein
VAACSSTEVITYGELEQRSNQLAHHLRQRGAGPERLVALCLERSVDMLIGVLGVLKAGAAYVPVDPASPQARLSFIVEDTQSHLIVTQERFAARFPGHRLLCMDGQRSALAAEPITLPPEEAVESNLAYVIYTSGSTGRPKGVAMTHQALLNLLEWQLQDSALQQGHRTLQFSSLSFDVSFQELFSTWGVGGTLVLIDEEQRRDPRRLLEVLQRQRVERLFLPFIALQQLAGAADEREFPGLVLREVITAGEALQSTPQIKAFFRGLPGCRLQNQYGPSETHVVTALTLGEFPEQWPARPPIGRALPGAAMHLLDAGLRPVPRGEVGELYVGGDAVARGYVERPGLTAERFIPNPFTQEPGGRLYRTGDLGRELPGGDIEFLGRADHQVKIRGIRVEPGEVEQVLASHPGVREGVVTAREDGHGQKFLVAYVVPRSPPPSAAVLRDFIRKLLPDPLVPAAFVLLEALPLTATGKVDRLALPAPERNRRELLQAYAAPRTPEEEGLAALFGEVLGLGQVGLHDDFFELGGSSLSATALVARLRRAFRVELPVRAIFEHPTVAALGSVVALGRTQQVETGPELRRRAPAGAPVPLSFAQQRLWLLSQLAPERADYNVPVLLHIEGALDADALEWSLGQLAARHEALRTVFPAGQGEPHQRILPPAPWSLRRMEAEPAHWEEWVRQEAVRPFQLEQGPPLRAVLLQAGAGRQALLLVMHHIVTDGWSLELMARELATLYRTRREGSGEELPELPLQYADFSQWQREWLRGPVLEAQLAYWRAQLAGAPMVLELPADRPRPAVQTSRGANHRFALEPALTAQLQALSTQEGVTLFATLLSAFQVLLHRYSGQEDLLVGSPVANRGRLELEGLVGFFVNTLVLRARLGGDPSFREVLKRARDTTLSAYSHQDVPFEKLVEVLQPQRDPSRTPLIQAVFALEMEQPRWSLPGLSVESRAVETGTAPFELTLTLVADGHGGLGGTLNFNADLFEAATARRMAEHFRALVKGLVADPGQRLSRLSLMDAEERRRVLVEWNTTAAEYPRERTLHELFEERAASQPEHCAVRAETRSLGYAELERQASGLARRLRVEGVGPETRVAICLERSPELVVGLLAILKAGGCYVPLDLAYPAQRLAFMLEDSRASVLLTRRGLRDRLPAFAGRVVDLDEEPVPSPEAPPGPVPVHPDSPAYILYTSGSTGLPKGVAVPHRGVVRLVKGATYAPLGPDDVVLQIATVQFDASAWELWSALLNGATLALFPPHVPTLGELCAFIEERKVTAALIPSGLFHQLVEAELGKLKGLRHLLVGGDVVSVPHARKVLEALPGCRLINAYGPTENSVITAAAAVRAEELGASVPIGVPLQNTSVYIVDGHLQPQPVGVPGELLTGGEGLARGYVSRPELTAERFIPDPFSGKPGARLYRTGDRARWRADGRLEFLGRIDGQVKIRGFRIELGEVESALAAHPDVREAAVSAWGTSAEDKRLVAYVVPRGSVESLHLRGFLREKLPEYLVPSVFVFLEAMPLTPNGKLDRRALPAPGASDLAARDETPPRTPEELLLARLWCDLLALPQVGIHANFFELGGHSLLATQLVSRLRQQLGVELPLSALFEAPTIAGLAHQLSGRTGQDAARAPALVARPRPGRRSSSHQDS